MTDKKHHKKHLSDAEEESNKLRKQKRKEIDNQFVDMGFDDDDDELYIEVQKFLR